MEKGRSNETAANAKPGGGGFKYIAEEIVLSIFPNLPGKSLVRFRCVSKQWSCWISKTKLRQCKKVIVRSFRPERNVLFQSIDEKLQVKDIDLSLGSLNPRESSIEASCDGLVLISVQYDLFLWNPTIHSCRKVLSLDDCEGYDGYAFVRGLCFDSHNNDYKVFYVARERYVNVGSCRNNSWQVLPLPYNMRLSGVVLNNYLHWHACQDYDFSSPSHDNIIYFDPKINSFLEVPTPDRNGYRIQGLGVLDGCLCVTRKEDVVTTEVLVMKEYGVKESWQTLFKIEAWAKMELRHAAYVTPLMYAKNKDQVLMRIGNDIFSHNLHTGEQVVKFEGQGYVYEDSLVEPSEYLTKEGGRWKARTNEQKVIVSVDQPFLFRSINQIGEAEDIDIVVNSTDPDAFPCLYGSCNGLLLIRVGLKLFLWNPVCYNYARLRYDRLRQYPPGQVISGLCFNSEKNDYKAVLVLNNHDWRDRWVVVVSFRTRSWSVINNFEYCSRNLKSGPTLDCHLHFWSSNIDSTDQILCFDPKTDKFTKMRLPDLPSRYRKSCIRGVGVLDGCLCLVHNDSFHSNKVYLMKQHGVKESWTCMFQFNYKNCSRVTPLFFCDEEKREVLIHAIRSDGHAALVSWDIGNKQCTEVTVLNGEGGGPIVYEETFARRISLKKAGTTINSQNREDISYRPKLVWYVEDYGFLWAIENSQSKLKKIEIEEGKRDKKAAAVFSPGDQLLRKSNAFSPGDQLLRKSNAFSLLAESEQQDP